MARILLTIVVPLLLPTALYLVWAFTLGAARGEGAAAWTAFPWVWLLAAGAALLAAMLVAVSVGFGTRQEGVYVAPRTVNGRIVPGHIEPRAPQ